MSTAVMILSLVPSYYRIKAGFLAVSSGGALLLCGKSFGGGNASTGGFISGQPRGCRPRPALDRYQNLNTHLGCTAWPHYWVTEAKQHLLSGSACLPFSFSLSVPVHHSVYLQVSLSISVSVCLHLFTPLFLCLNVSVIFLSVCLTVCRFINVSVSVCLCGPLESVSFCLVFVFLFVFVYVSMFAYGIYQYLSI